MKLLNTAIIRLSLVLLAGIFTGFYIPLPLTWSFLLLAGILVVFIFSFIRAKNLLLQDAFFGGICLCLFFALGLISVHLQQPENRSKHYSHLPSTNNPNLLLHITEALKPSLYKERFVAEVMKLDEAATHGKILLLIPREGPRLSPGEKLLLHAPLLPIPHPLNPQQFNYRDYMAHRGILYQVSPSLEEFLPLDSGDRSLQEGAHNFRERIISRLRQQNFGREELAVIQALLLGQRQDLSQERNDYFAAAGLLHILAVSGLHVGMILWLLNWLFAFLDRWRRGRSLKILLLILLLWAYALLAGLTPSVVRAVCMFSFVAVGMQLRRRSSVLNSVFLSMLLLLLLRPNWALEVGFQLSYMAVFSIVVLQPILSKLYTPGNRVLRYFWSLGSVSLAAQVGVLPLSLYYFHQFPGLFFLSNLVVLPFLGVLLALGFLIILLTMLDLLPETFAQIYELMIRWLNLFVEWVAKQEDFLFRDLQFSQFHLFAFYGLFLSLFLLFIGTSFRRILLLLFAFICLQGVYIHEAFRENHSELIVFHQNRHTVLGFKRGAHLNISSDFKEPVADLNLIRNYKLERRISIQKSESLRNIYSLEDGWLLVIDSSKVYRVPGLHPERILLIGSPEINLDRLLRELRPKEIIADGSNYRSYIERWRASCRKKKIPFHYTGEKGSYILKTKPHKY